MPDCTHEKETLIHGLESLTKAQYELYSLFSNWGFISGVLSTLQDHEARELGLTKEAHALLVKAEEQDPDLSIDTNRFQEEFVSRALAKLLACECGRK